jgi:23S rRNA (cytosine1962-C5)-methyltransferase
VLDTSIARVDSLTEAQAETCREVDLVTHDGQYVATGLENPRSRIRVRLYRWDEGPLDDRFWVERIDDAIALRTQVLQLDRQEAGCRLIFSEGDGLSGLTLDRYDRWLVAHFSSLALWNQADRLLPILLEQSRAEGLIARTDRGMASREGLPPDAEHVLGTLPNQPVTILENGLRFLVDLRPGQKTGFYLDQRENRKTVASYCEGRRVLDLFCYSGGFALTAARLGAAAEVLGVDSSEPAVVAARLNADANAIERVSFEQGQVLRVLERLKQEGRRFDVVICDPPKYAQRASDLDNALKGYVRLNLAALDVLEQGGILATCSCSGAVDRALFAQMLAEVAERSGRSIQILEQRGQAADHPVSAACLETEYLKCFICRVG